MATGDLHLLGTLYTGGVKRLMPTSPINEGNITAFTAGQMIEIRNTDVNESYKLRWREVSTGVGKLLIADRNILHSASWDDLNAQGLITGKEIIIDGKLFKIRVLTGGATRREGGAANGGNFGGKLPNEWDNIIQNEGNYPNITNENAMWNWSSMYTWTKEAYEFNLANRVIRGYTSTLTWAYTTQSSRATVFGYRPVLEVLHSPPNLSPNINGVYRDYSDGWVNINGTYRKIDSIYNNINGVWRKS